MKQTTTPEPWVNEGATPSRQAKRELIPNIFLFLLFLICNFKK
jgi:hypothetical protein